MWGTSVDLSAALSGPVVPTGKRQRLAGDHDDPTDSIDIDADALDPRRALFCEFFSGEGPLTSAVLAAGVPARSPDDLAHGGTDFEHKSAVEEIRRELAELAASGVKLVVHFAPPCSTFSRARDRSSKTKLRSSDFPQGLPRHAQRTHSANLVARHTLDLAEGLARDCGAAVSIENPETSYL